ncbi:hypothetical protein ACFYPC_14430 [Streptomyces sp. NPDC005808]|uniref:hypothetical protein n=1 Tax=Streptomyces sp. NPDC005808 TaxID=3364734 RepID=UPI0036930B0D
MPRPTAAQLAYGSCTVIISTLAMLLLSQTSSGVGIAAITLSALVLGLLVAMTVPLPKPARTVQLPVVAVRAKRVPAQRESAQRETASVAASVASEPVREPANP